jgi:hypothetical protein
LKKKKKKKNHHSRRYSARMNQGARGRQEREQAIKKQIRNLWLLPLGL